MTVARQVVPGRTYLVSRRCTQRQYLLRPDGFVERAYLYCLGEAATRFDITLHAWTAMGNHVHMIVRDNQGNLPEFLAHLHKMIAKVMNAYRGRWENFWATEQPNAVYLVNPEDAFDKLLYVLTNPVADHLVDRVSDWPGASSFRLHVSGRARVVARPRVFFRENGVMPEEVTLEPERLRGYEHLSETEWREAILQAVLTIESQARSERAASGRGVMGRKRVLAVSPTDSPKTVEPRRTLRPHVACRNRDQRIRELVALRAFRLAHRAALTRFRAGERGVEFPYGTYGMLRFRSHFLVATQPPLAA